MMKTLLRSIVLGLWVGLAPAAAAELEKAASNAVESSPVEEAKAEAASGEEKREAVRPWAYKRLQRAFAALADERYDEVIEALDEMKPNGKLNSHERALMWQTYGFAYTNLEDYTQAAESFSQCLAQNALPKAATLHTRYNLAQLLVMLERPEEAIVEFDLWFRDARNPSPTAFYMAAMAHMQKGENREALRLARQALERATVPKESWLQLVVALNLKEEDFAGAEPVVRQLIELYPKKAYWMQLAALCSETGRPETALTILELVHAQGLLDQSSEYMALAQMYLYNQIPYQAAEVLQEGLEKKVLARDAKTLQLLGDSWLHARERERALTPMREAAEIADDGNAYVRLAQVLVEQEKWNGARQALAAALDKGGLRNPGHASLLLGIASVNEQRWSEAEDAFVAAAADESTEKAAHYWLQHLASRRPSEAEGDTAAEQVAAPIGAPRPA